MGHPTSDEDPSSHTVGVGEYSGVEAEQFLDRSKALPEPVRSNPVPLTVRRHTEESRAIWLANLREALPVDMLAEDRDKIATALLDVAIYQGNVLRRKRLIDRLMDTIETMENWDVDTNLPLTEWVDVMHEAAEEIRSLL